MIVSCLLKQHVSTWEFLLARLGPLLHLLHPPLLSMLHDPDDTPPPTEQHLLLNHISTAGTSSCFQDDDDDLTAGTSNCSSPLHSVQPFAGFRKQRPFAEDLANRSSSQIWYGRGLSGMESKSEKVHIQARKNSHIHHMAVVSFFASLQLLVRIINHSFTVDLDGQLHQSTNHSAHLAVSTPNAQM